MSATEKMIYKELFNIKFNDKQFKIFIDKYGRRTFLEINNSNQYIYPLLTDFIMLHRIYNERNPFLLYSERRLPVHGNRYENPNVTFREFVRNYIGTMAEFTAVMIATSLVAGVMTGRTFKLERLEDQVKIVGTYVMVQ